MQGNRRIASGLLIVFLGLVAACVPFPSTGNQGPVTPTPAPATPTERMVVVTATPAATATERVVVVTATAPSVTGDPITNAVMAQDVQGDNFEPVGITNSFPAQQSIFHAVITIKEAPDSTRVQVVWRVVDDGNPSEANSEMARYELTTQGSRNLDFTFKPNAGRLPAGTYKADIYLNGNLDRSVSFSVAPQPPSGVVTGAVMAKDVQGDNFEPVGVTNNFNADQAIFHAVVTIKDAPQGTKLHIVWIVVDDSDPNDVNTKMAEYEVTTDGSRNVDFTFKPNNGHLRPGKYRADLYVNGQLNQSLNFTVLAMG